MPAAAENASCGLPSHACSDNCATSGRPSSSTRATSGPRARRDGAPSQRTPSWQKSRCACSTLFCQSLIRTALTPDAPRQARFGISLSPSTLAFVPLRHRWLIEDSTYPRLTLIGQSLGSVVLALEGLVGAEGVAPDVWIGASARPPFFFLESKYGVLNTGRKPLQTRWATLSRTRSSRGS